MRAGEVAAAAGVNRETLRYYERRGLLRSPDRSLGGHRVYHDHDATTLRVIKAAQRIGFHLNEIADLLEVRRDSHGQKPTPGLHDRAVIKLAEVEQKSLTLNRSATPSLQPSTSAATTYAAAQTKIAARFRSLPSTSPHSAPFEI